MQELVRRHWSARLQQWERSGQTKLRFFSRRVLANSRAAQPLGDSVFLLYEDGDPHASEDAVGRAAAS